MDDRYYKEIFEYPIKEFKGHLENPSNERIIFSGKYGTGKTKFLEYVFEKENQEKIFGADRYEVYRVFPINYSISSNEDILRYIKYDIITEMLKKIPNVEEIDLGYLETLPVFIKNNLHKVAAAMVYMVPKLGKEVVDAFEKIDKLKEEFFKFHDASNESSGDKMIKYLERIEATEGSLYENDIITQIVSDTIKKNTSKETVLIVDDVDRLDPEHLFRILNVFAAHFDSSEPTKNKFNFDKIIIVCDFNNIRNAFHHKYGTEVDFMGYIDKFYSSDIYHFDNRKAIINVLGKVLEGIKIFSRDGDTENFIRQLYLRDNLVLTLLTLLIEKKFVSLRNILKIQDKIISYHYEPLNFYNKHSEVAPWQSLVIMELRLLSDFLGDYKNLKRILKECADKNEPIHNFEFHFGRFLTILFAASHNFFRNETFEVNYKDTIIVVETKSNRANGIDWVNLYEYKGQEGKNLIKGGQYYPRLPFFWSALLDTIETLHSIGYIK